MGTWGMEPRDNDTSGDLWYAIKKTWEKHGVENATFNLHNKIKTDFPDWCDITQRKWEHLGMLQEFLMHLADFRYVDSETFWSDELVPDILWTAHQYCQDCLNDKKWHEDWDKNTNEMIYQTNIFKQKILGLIINCCD